MVWNPPRESNCQRGEGGVGFLVRECLVDEVEFITDVHYEESVWKLSLVHRVCVYAY